MGEESHESGLRPGSAGRALWPLALVCAIALAHSSGLDGGFVWDDRHLIEDRAIVEELQAPGRYLLEPFWSHPDLGEFAQPFYRPLVVLSFAIDHELWDGDPRGFHHTNLLLHLAVCGLLYWGCRRAGASMISSGLLVAIFGLFPRLTESVAWISGRTDLLAGLGVMAAILAHSSRKDAVARRSVAAFFLGVGLLSKEVAFAGLCSLMVREAIGVRGGRTTGRQAIANLVPAVVVASIYLVMRSLAITDLPEGPALSAHFSWSQRLLLFPLQTLGTYAAMLATPFSPVARIGRLGIVEPTKVALGVLTAVIAIGLAVRAVRRPWPAAAVGGLALAAAALLPVLNAIESLQPIVASDRYLYLPLIGLVLVAARLWRFDESRRLVLGAQAGIALLCVASALVTHSRSAQWNDDLSLWQHDVANTHPLDPMPRALLAAAYEHDDAPEAALRLYRESREIEARFAARYPGYPGDFLTWGNLGLVLTELGRFDEAIAELTTAVATHPAVPTLHLDLAVAHARALEFDAAEASFARALALHPAYEKARQSREQMRRARATLAPLPPARDDEPPSIAGRRATALALLGRLRDAGALFSRISRNPHSSTKDLRSAAVFLVMRGETGAARTALAALQERTDAPPDTVAALETRLATRSLP